MISTYVFLVISSSTAVKSQSSISREWNSPRTLEHECLNPLMSSDVLSYLVGSREFAGLSDCWVSRFVVWPFVDESAGFDDDKEEVAITRKVVRSKSMTSVALHAWAKVERCVERMLALGMRVCTILDQA